MTNHLHGIRACVFDAYGTLFDFGSAAAACADVLGDRTAALTARWRDKQLQYSWLRGLQGRYARGAEQPDAAAQEVAQADGPRGDAGPGPARGPLKPALWDGLAGLAGRTVRTAKGEPFEVAAVERGAGVTVVPLDGGQRWVVGAEELEAAHELFAGGEPADRLAAVRLRAAGGGARHPEIVAGLLRALRGEG